MIPMFREMSDVRISVVIPAYNAGRFVARCLAGLKAQDLDPGAFEIIVVDDGSSDDTAAVVTDAALPNLTLLRQKNGGPAMARNAGIRQACAPIIAFLDSDCVPRPDWLNALLAALEAQPHVLGIEGRTLPEDAPFTPLDHFIDNPNGGFYWTCNIAYRAETLWEIGGFDEGFPQAASEDIDLAERVKKLGQIVFAPEAVVDHLILPRSFKGHISRAMMFSSLIRLARKHPGLIPNADKGFAGMLGYQLWYFLWSIVGFRRWLLKNPMIFFQYTAIHLTMIAMTIQHLPRFYRVATEPLEIREALSLNPQADVS